MITGPGSMRTRSKPLCALPKGPRSASLREPHRQGPRYRLVFHPAVANDIEALAAYGPEVVAAARVALDDLAHGRVAGKALGARRVSGDLTGLARVKFDVPGTGAQRFRLLYTDLQADIRAVLAVGVRDEHAIYHMAVARITAAEEGVRPGPRGEREPG